MLPGLRPVYLIYHALKIHQSIGVLSKQGVLAGYRQLAVDVGQERHALAQELDRNSRLDLVQEGLKQLASAIDTKAEGTGAEEVGCHPVSAASGHRNYARACFKWHLSYSLPQNLSCQLLFSLFSFLKRLLSESVGLQVRATKWPAGPTKSDVSETTDQPWLLDELCPVAQLSALHAIALGFPVCKVNRLTERERHDSAAHLW